ncbi:unnamed protein product [Oppiella nova]|uniref:Peptidase C1A papain C-terminal domain-containing protein n=1 Tax=Oppiella nova TaxID=334625 RepID=A0A7R9MS71_9ACAR|nr:unnamed protein product [Oppiella nova]CAG2181872.1 unnamed protein product [Oppiella nova]
MSNWLSEGPFVVYTKSSSHVFQTYAGGILDSRECNTTGPLDHSLLLVGEGVDNGTDYWFTRNNYGEVGVKRVTYVWVKAKMCAGSVWDI